VPSAKTDSDHSFVLPRTYVRGYLRSAASRLGLSDSLDYAVPAIDWSLRSAVSNLTGLDPAGAATISRCENELPS
jgi:hypothetical protein